MRSAPSPVTLGPQPDPQARYVVAFTSPAGVPLKLTSASLLLLDEARAEAREWTRHDSTRQYSIYKLEEVA